MNADIGGGAGKVAPGLTRLGEELWGRIAEYRLSSDAQTL